VLLELFVGDFREVYTDSFTLYRYGSCIDRCDLRISVIKGASLILLLAPSISSS
jgi:hypothetical protein